MLVYEVNNPRGKTYCPLPRLLLLRRRPSSGLWKTEVNGARKLHDEQEANSSVKALISCPAVISTYISALLPTLAVAS